MFQVLDKDVGGDRAYVIAQTVLAFWVAAGEKLRRLARQGFQPGNKYGGRPREDFDQRFFSKVHMTSDCWTWTGKKERSGYARIREPGRDGTRWLVHRLAYVRMVGRIPGDLTIDHLCRNRLCVRPDHLEVCSRGENARRGVLRARV